MTTDTARWLDELGVTFTYHEALDLDLVDEAASLRNQARFDPLDDDAVDRYAAAMDAGDRFPPIIVHHAKSPKAKQPWIILSGNHRYHAARKADVKLAGYVLDKVEDPTVLLRIAYQDNAHHGLGLSVPERLRHALHLVDNGFTNRDAGRCVGIADTEIATAKTVRAAQERARAGGVAAFDTLPMATQKAIASIDLDVPFLAAARLVTRARLTAPQASEITKAVKATRSEAAALEAVKELEAQHRERIQSHAGGMAKREISGRSALLDACSRVGNLSQPDVVRSVIDGQDAAILRRSCAKAIEKLQSLSAAIGDR
jgi:ParB-like chromosome segregation protein Spo0J